MKFTAIVVIGPFYYRYISGTVVKPEQTWNHIFRTILVLPWLMPEVVIALIFKMDYESIVWSVKLRDAASGIIRGGVSWLGDTKYAFISVVLVCIWKGYPLVMVNALAALQSVSTDIYEGCAKVEPTETKYETFLELFFRLLSRFWPQR